MFDHLPKSRADAKENGSVHYYNGKPCPKGHLEPRYTTTGSCVKCIKKQGKSQTKKGYFVKRYNENKSKILSAQRRKYREDPSKIDARNKSWQLRNKDKVRAIKSSYKARRKLIEGVGASSSEVSAWLQLQEKSCVWCGIDCAENYHIDHVFPLSKGGKHQADNLVISCPKCNISKSAKHPDFFLATKGHHIVMREQAIKEV